MQEYQSLNGIEINQSDKELLNRMAQGDNEAFTTVYKRYWEDLFVTAARMLREKKEASDIVQDVFLSLWNRRGELNITGSLAAYLHTGVRYQCTHYIEKNITRKGYLAYLVETVDNYCSEDASNALQLKELQQILHKTVNSMPPKMQVVYKLSRHELRNHKEIAKDLNISVETVKKHIQHALHQIKAALVSHLLCFLIISPHYFF